MTTARELVDRHAGSTVHINIDGTPGEFSADVLVPAPFTALRAVLDLHWSGTGDCQGCDEDWPCNTVRAITTAFEGG